LSLLDAARITGIAKGTLSILEHGHRTAYARECDQLELVYGFGPWYPPSVLRVLTPDRLCAKCGKPLPFDARRNRRKHEVCP